MSVPSLTTYAIAPAELIVNVNALFVGVTCVQGPVPFWTANQTGIWFASQVA